MGCSLLVFFDPGSAWQGKICFFSKMLAPATSKGCLLEAFEYIKPTSRHPLDVAGYFFLHVFQ